MAEVDRLERVHNKDLCATMGFDAWQAHVEQACCDLVREEQYYRTEQGALGPEHEAFCETIKTESLRILRGFVKKGGDVKSIKAMRADEEVPEGGKYTPVKFRCFHHHSALFIRRMTCQSFIHVHPELNLATATCSATRTVGCGVIARAV